MYVEENTDYYAETVTEPINKTSQSHNYGGTGTDSTESRRYTSPVNPVQPNSKSRVSRESQLKASREAKEML